MPEAEPAQSREETRLEDGTRILSIRIRAGRRDFDEQHAVTAPDGESRIFETLGATQTIRDSVSGEILGRSTFTANGVEPDATIQPALLPAVPAAVVVAQVLRTLELARTLFAFLSARRGGYGTVLGATAHEFRGAEDFRNKPAIWVGPLDLPALDAACPKTGAIQTQLDAVNTAVRQENPFRTPSQIGNEVHSRMHFWVREQKNLASSLNFRSTKKGSQLMSTKPAQAGSTSITKPAQRSPVSMIIRRERVASHGRTRCATRRLPRSTSQERNGLSSFK